MTDNENNLAKDINVPHKEQMIIDGVDIRKCKHFEALYESRPNGFGGITIENYCYLYEDNCEKYPQCLYRSNQLQQLETQLKRKKQECEKYKQTIAKIKDICSKMNCESLVQDYWCKSFTMGCCEKLLKIQLLQIISEVME